MRPFLHVSLAVALACGLVAECRATGFYGPSEYLQDGGANVEASPEFYWELEVKRLASAFHPIEKRFAAAGGIREGEASEESPRKILTAKADAADFAAALKEGRIKPPDPARAAEQHEAARKFVGAANVNTGEALPEEFESEFAAYHRGALAYRRGEEHLNEARRQWEDLLKLPEGERHYRSVWSAFMIGKAALKMGDPDAVKWFQRTRELAQAGFADSLGMAADSYGWEARSEWKQGHPEKAAPLYLTQLALGDESAIVSLKALIPDREQVEGWLNYERQTGTDDKTGLEAAARDPLLRRLVTAHILATASSKGYFTGDAKDALQRSTRWLAVIKEAKVSGMEDAEYLGWLAYNSGLYDDAARWLDAAKVETPAAWWLRAKLERRAGQLKAAAQNMSKAWESIHDVAGYTAWRQKPEGVEDQFYPRSEESWSFAQEASGDLGALHLERGDFVQALDILWRGRLWEDAAFVAERVLTLDEAKKYVDQQPVPAAPAIASEPNDATRLRYLLGRRCVREDRYDEASRYLIPPYDKIVSIYASALKDGDNAKLPEVERARAWFRAAWLARHDGMELMGTEGAPDGFVSGGDFESTDLASQQLRGLYDKGRHRPNEESTPTTPITLKVSKEEKQRLEKNKIVPDIRYHYRIVAAALAMRAAKLLPDNSEELADVLNVAGLWVENRDEKAGDRCLQALQQRCAQTKIGQAAIGRGKFVDQLGPWSEAERNANEAMHKELDPKKPGQ